MSGNLDQLIRQAEIAIRDLGNFIDALRYTATSLRTDLEDISRAHITVDAPAGTTFPGYGRDPLAEIRGVVAKLDGAIADVSKRRDAWQAHLQKLKAAKGARELEGHAAKRPPTVSYKERAR